jgi:endonuclease/exonuclease/phosphatase (EEP) superfamily protein YafD
LRFIVGLARLMAGLLILVTAVPAILALFGFVLPPLDLLNHLQLVWFFGTLIALVLGLLVHGWRWALALAVIGFAASAWTFVPEWLSSLPARPTANGTVLKLMTHNVFGLNYDVKRVAAVIAAENPDIVALQEYFPEQQGLDGLLKPTYPYAVRCQGGKRANLGLYSKIPFDREMSEKDCPDSANATQRTAHIIAGFTLADGTHFSVMTTHMDWPFPIDRQRQELAAAAAEAKAVIGPLIVVGDFNSTPWSYAMKGFEAAAGLRRETRNLVTFPELFTVPPRISRDEIVHTAPFLPLDQVFERGVTVTELHRGPATGSDHLPVVFTFAVAKDQRPS